MSEVITIQPGSTTPQLGLKVTSNDIIRLTRDATTGVVTAFGSGVGDTIAPVSPNDVTVFNLSGEGGNDSLTGGAASDMLSGGLGRDQLVGGRGSDTLDGGLRSDRLIGGEGNDVLLAGAGRDSVFGNAGDDTISGGDAADRLSGGTGNDILSPGAGRDILIGGPGEDVFQFETDSTGRGWIDEIRDFAPEDDTIRLARGLLPRSGLPITRPNAPLDPAEFRTVDSIGSLSQDEQAKIIYDRSTGLVYYNSPQNTDLVLLFKMRRNLDLNSTNFEIF